MVVVAEAIASIPLRVLVVDLRHHSSAQTLVADLESVQGLGALSATDFVRRRGRLWFWKTGGCPVFLASERSSAWRAASELCLAAAIEAWNSSACAFHATVSSSGAQQIRGHLSIVDGTRRLGIAE